ncbi:MAG: DUF177 domain-containing protein [Lachnospiraceae bacterium]|nr:DUF177 domain-containing protein [Lachnospiraceae bacterium]
MQIHLSEILSKEGKAVEKKIELERTSFQFHGEEFPIVEKSPVELVITNTGNQELLIKVKVSLSVAIPCGRCLKDVITEFCLDFSREADMKLSEEEREEQLDENNYIAGYQLDVDALIADEVVLQWPMKVLCKEDCQGICSVCGQDLNLKQCGCDRTVLDPRMAAFLDIFEQFKEV